MAVRVLLTGGSGFIGANITRALLKHGYEVRSFDRGESETIAGLDVEVVRGDIRDGEAVRKAMVGCPVVIHTAALYELSGHPARLYEQVNVGGTRNVLEAARRLGVDRIIYTSSVAAVGTRADGLPADESCFQTPAGTPGPYERSKVLAEEVALAEAKAGAPIVILNPSTPFGPWDARPTPSGRIILDFCRGRMPFYIDTGINVVAVEDVAEAHFSAIERGAPGERFVLGCNDMTLLEILQTLSAITGRQAPRHRLPFWAVYAAALVEDAFLRQRRLARIPLAGIRLARHRMFFDSSKAVRVLGLGQTPAETAFHSAIDWFASHGYLRTPAKD